MSHQEAPSSATFKLMINGYEVLYTIRDDDHISLLKTLGELTKQCQAKGYGPAPIRTIGGGGRQGPAPVPMPADGSAPICPTHNRQMVKKEWGWVCSTKLDDGSWCKQKAR